MHISQEDSDNKVLYSPVVEFTLHTPDGKSYQAYEYWPGSYDQQADA